MGDPTADRIDRLLAKVSRLQAQVVVIQRDARLSNPRVDTTALASSLASAPFLMKQGVSIPSEFTGASNLAAGAGISVSSATVTNTVALVPPLHASTHQNGGSDEIATATAGANAIPKASASGKLDTWISDADASTKGKIQLAGALGGTAASPTVAGRFLSRSILTVGSGNYTVPANVNKIRVQLQGPGGGGGGVHGEASKAAAAAGGGAGAYVDVLLTVSPSDTLAYNVPAGGAGGTAGTNPGSAAASDTTITQSATTYTAAKGSGGATAAAGTAVLINAGGAGGAATNGDMNHSGQPGFDGLVLSGTVSKSGNGAPSRFGGGAVGRAGNGAGNTGSGYGAGGSGANRINSAVDSAGGDGAPGVILIEEYS